jgi:hypothetical protein
LYSGKQKQHQYSDRATNPVKQYKAQTQGRQSLPDFFFKKNCSQHVILADVWLSPEGSSICPDAGVQRTILDDKMLINGWETVFNDLSIYRN